MGGRVIALVPRTSVRGRVLALVPRTSANIQYLHTEDRFNLPILATARVPISARVAKMHSENMTLPASPYMQLPPTPSAGITYLSSSKASWPSCASSRRLSAAAAIVCASQPTISVRSSLTVETSCSFSPASATTTGSERARFARSSTLSPSSSSQSALGRFDPPLSGSSPPRVPAGTDAGADTAVSAGSGPPEGFSDTMGSHPPT
mmetsp:Transcript_38882/g.88339  ORF Transcript_38882/g.88339 Transcript_38882/m.88339 type:complete len:206 (+) Transcript_38882:162-779(+)